MKLYDFEKSGNCYKIRLFLSILNLEYTKIAVNVGAGETNSSEFLRLNPNGLVPVLVDGNKTIYDSAAILSYLAISYADESWFPRDAVQFSRVIRWLAFEQSEGRYGLARARILSLKTPSKLARFGDLEEAQALGKTALETLNKQLAETTWLAGGTAPTICDIACYPYTAMCGEGGLTLRPYSAIKRWMNNIEELADYVALPTAIKA